MSHSQRPLPPGSARSVHFSRALGLLPGMVRVYKPAAPGQGEGRQHLFVLPQLRKAYCTEWVCVWKRAHSQVASWGEKKILFLLRRTTETNCSPAIEGVCFASCDGVRVILDLPGASDKHGKVAAHRSPEGSGAPSPMGLFRELLGVGRKGAGHNDPSCPFSPGSEPSPGSPLRVWWGQVCLAPLLL